MTDKQPFGDAMTGRIKTEKPIYDFHTLSWGKASPTDIDGAMDFRGKIFITYEGKGFGVPIDRAGGQFNYLVSKEYAIYRNGDADTLTIYFEHPEDPTLFRNEEGHIIVNECKPVIVRFNGVEQDLASFPKHYKIKDIVTDYTLASCADNKEVVYLLTHY